MRPRYTAAEVRASIEANRERLFAPFAVNRPSNWSPCQRTRDLVCIGYWIEEEMIILGANDADRKTQGSYYNRWSRSEDDLFELGARTLNTVLDGAVEQNRIPLRRWG